MLTDAANQLAPETGIGVEVDLTAPEDVLDVPARTAVLRVALEALRNVRKHSGATRVQVSTHFEPQAEPSSRDQWILEVHDDGHGFSVDAGRRAGRATPFRSAIHA